MAVSVHYANSMGKIPAGAGFRDCPEFSGCIGVVDSGGKTIAIVSIAGMMMVEIDAATNGDDDAKGVKATAKVAARSA